ncbi:MAG: MFS transporter [Rhodospirillaceae bacterium]|nr:MFS transporter [Rhodospirillaceae bacterium]
MGFTTKYDAADNSKGYRLLLLIVMAGTTMLYSLTMTLVNIILPQLQGALSASQDQISWIITLNVLATAIATPLTGSVVALFGRRAVLIFCSASFTLATFACGLCDSLEGLIFFRVLQGAVGAPLVPLSQATLLQSYPRHMHARVNAIYGMSVVVGPALAPSLGGYLSEIYDWRWVFFMMVPLGLFATIGNLRYVKDDGRQAGSKFDYLGFTFFSAAIVCLQLVLDRGEREDWLDSLYIISLLTFMAVSFYMFVVNTGFSSQPYIDPRIFLNRNYVIGILLCFVYGSLNFTPLVLLPAMLQNLQGYPDLLIGWILAMRGIGMIVGFMIAAPMGRLDPRVGMILGMGLIGLSGWLMSLYDLNVTLSAVSWASALQGFGCGILWVPLAVITFSTTPVVLFPAASAFFHLLRNLGTSVFVALSVTLLIRTSKVSYSELTEKLNPFEERLSIPAVIGEGSIDWTANLSLLAKEVSRQSLMIGYDNVFYFYALTCLFSLPVLSFITMRKS